MSGNGGIVLDGSQGEGGGQILRSALALSMATGKPFRIHRIRAGRRKPGLMRQHLTCVKAAARVCSAQLAGAEIGSTTLEFRPGPMLPGRYEFSVGSAGSSTLVFHTLSSQLWTIATVRTRRLRSRAAAHAVGSGAGATG